MATRKLVKCGHCEQEVSKRTFYHHKRLYYDSKSKTWNHDARIYHEKNSSADDFQLPSVSVDHDNSSITQTAHELEDDDHTELNDGKKQALCF